MRDESLTTLQRLAAELATLTRDVDRLRGDVGRLYGHAEQLGLDVQATSDAASSLGAAASALGLQLGHELVRSRGRRQTIFVVDHDSASRELAADSLASAGFDVQTLSRGDDVIELVRMAVPKAVLIDLTLPGMPASVVAEYLRTNPRTARVCRLGMTAFVPSARDARPFTSLIDKPLSPGFLVEFVKQSLQRPDPGRPRSPTAR